MNYYSNKARQAGMTLIELTVVLLVLIGLAGLLIPYVSGFVGRTHDSSGADSIQEVAKAIAGYDAKYQGYPGGLDIMTDSTNGMITYMMNSGVATATAMTAINTQSLFRGGITNLKGMCDDAADADCATFNPTFDYYDSTQDWVISGNGNVAIGGGAAAAPTTEALAVVAAADVDTVCSTDNAARDNDGDGTQDYIYVMLGVGPESDMTGRTVQSAPVHFAQIGAMNANNRYNRFVAIFAVDNDNASADGSNIGKEGSSDNARFVCGAMAMSILEGPQQAVQRFYDRQDEES